MPKVKFEKYPWIKYILGLVLLLFLLLPLWWPKKIVRIEQVRELVKWNAGQMQVVVYSSYSQNHIDGILKAAWQEVERLDTVMNEYSPDSEAGKLRLGLEQGVKVQIVSSELFHLLAFSQTISNNSKGAFDITVGPLIQLWKKCGKENRLPTPEEYGVVKNKIGWQHLDLSQPLHVRLQDAPALSISLGAYSKGYAVDQVLSLLQQQGIESGMVNMGGDLCCFGPHIWKIGVQDPSVTEADAPESAIGILQVQNCAVATSGHYRRYTEIQGTRYSHILDPRTLQPVDMRIVSTTVIADTGIKADAYATAFCILPVEESLTIAQQNNLHVAIITHDPDGYHLHTTPHFDQYWYQKPTWDSQRK